MLSRPSTSTETQTFLQDIFGDCDVDPESTVDRTLEVLIDEEIKNYMKKVVKITNRVKSPHPKLP